MRLLRFVTLSGAVVSMAVACSSGPSSNGDPIASAGSSTPSPQPSPTSGGGTSPAPSMPPQATGNATPDAGLAPPGDGGGLDAASPADAAIGADGAVPLDAGNADGSLPAGYCTVAKDCDGQNLPHPDCLGSFVCTKENTCVWVCGTDPPQEQCGPTTCAVGDVCCNESCGICSKPGVGCSKQLCLPSGEPCGKVTCATGEVCCNASCGVCTKPGDACTQQVCASER